MNINGKINWESFENFNQDARGIRYKFEDLCRQLFANEFIADNVRRRYLHSNPNNPGFECEPIFDEKNQRWIGFQAKYFDGDADYNQIQNSARTIVSHYTGKVQHVYLYCNKPLTSSAAGYTSTVKLLNDAGITMEPVTDTAILDLVRKYPYIGLYYFGNHSLTHDWFARHNNYMFEVLGERYNSEFNISTSAELKLSLFVNDSNAVDYINDKKSSLLEKIQTMYSQTRKYRPYLRKVEEAVKALSDINFETLENSFGWKETVDNAVKTDVAVFNQQKNELNKQCEAYYAKVYGEQQEQDREKRLDDYHKYREYEDKINDLNLLINLDNEIALSEDERSLITGNVLFIVGKAGTGKSHLLAMEADTLIKENQEVLLLLGGMYLTAEPIKKQIMSNLEQNISFDELIDILEAIGERENKIIPVFIDAINETWEASLWKNSIHSIIDKVKSCPMVKIVFSYRLEYKKLLIPEVMKDEGIVEIKHVGFADNGVNSVRDYLNHYNIPFTATEYFNDELTNPLFLSLYCKTYDGTEVSLEVLYNRLLNTANRNIFIRLSKSLKDKGFTEDDDIVTPFINRLAIYLINNKKRFIYKNELTSLPFWNEYGLIPVLFIKNLVNEGILYDSVIDDKQVYYFAYDQMYDYYGAKAIFCLYNNKNDLKKFLAETILGINDGKVSGIGNIDLFINACALYRNKYKEECIDIIDSIKNDEVKTEIFSSYISSFKWRNSKDISFEEFFGLLQKYDWYIDDLWDMFINNSLKISNQLNADGLHAFLSTLELNKRDHVWTLYINGLTDNENNRVVQLIDLFKGGGELKFQHNEQIELLLTLFCWLLTSSNRTLRDNASKAMIEILKKHFKLCNVLLEKFKSINDPYVVQRLYGIIFGACCKRIKLSDDFDQFELLAENVYGQIFATEKVYPDILLRDYARNIIELFLHEYPGYNGIINSEKIRPPYKSEPIPDIEDQHYLEREYTPGTGEIISSMRFNGMGGYGDFGRYIFQSKLHYFDINDDKKIFNAAVFFILNDLGYSDEFFGEYDRTHSSYNRTVTVKTERIGKKYEWIALNHVMALVTDNYEMSEINYDVPSHPKEHYQGTWDPYMRDFDPTLNVDSMHYDGAPSFQMLDEFDTSAKNENNSVSLANESEENEWLEEKGIFYQNIQNLMALDGNDGEKWISFSRYTDTGRDELGEEKLLVWAWQHAYFVTDDQLTMMKQLFANGSSIVNDETRLFNQTYVVFNREYPWAPSCKDLRKYSWITPDIETGDSETIKENVSTLDWDSYEKLLIQYGIWPDDNGNFVSPDAQNNKERKIPDPPYKTIISERKKFKNIGPILHADATLMWESEYDASKEGTVSWNVPCAQLIEELNLRQTEYDGFYFDDKGDLVAFDTHLNGQKGGVVIRQRFLNSFLSKTHMHLIWIVNSSKEIHASDLSIAKWREWQGLFVYDGNKVHGKVCMRKLDN